MADVRAVKNGNWSDTTVWNTGALPTTADDVYSNTFTVNVNTSFQVLSLRNTSGTGITAGGTFNFNSGSVSGSLTGATPLFVSSTSTPIQITHNTSTVELTCTNDINLTLVASSQVAILQSSNSDFILTCPNVRAGANANAAIVLSKTAGNLTINGNVVGPTTGIIGGRTYTIFATAGNLIISGSVISTCPSVSNAGSSPIRQSAGNLTINGDVLTQAGGASITAFPIWFSGENLTIRGNITSALSFGIFCDSAATISITGSITPSSTVPGLSLTGASTLTYSGSLASSANQPAIVSSNASATNIFTGPFVNTNDTMAVQCIRMNLTADASTTWNFGNITLFSPERLAFYPSASDIRQGTTYADGTVSGSLAMPPATAVIAGTPTDNTTGSAVLTPSQLQDAVWGRDLSQMTETGSIGNRLARVSTTGTTGAQIASYLL
jgi:hypothetical protein